MSPFINIKILKHMTSGHVEKNMNLSNLLSSQSNTFDIWVLNNKKVDTWRCWVYLLLTVDSGGVTQWSIPLFFIHFFVELLVCFESLSYHMLCPSGYTLLTMATSFFPKWSGIQYFPCIHWRYTLGLSPRNSSLNMYLKLNQM